MKKSGNKRKKKSEEESSDAEECITEFTIKKNLRSKKHKKEEEDEEDIIVEDDDKEIEEKASKRCKKVRNRGKGVQDEIKVDVTFDKFEDLPLELNLHILSFLEARDLCNVAQSCKKWREVLDNDKKLWKTLCRKRWMSCTLKKQDTTWKSLFKRYILLEKRIFTSQSPGVTAISIAIEEVYGIRLGAASPCQAHCHSPDR